MTISLSQLSTSAILLNLSNKILQRMKTSDLLLKKYNFQYTLWTKLIKIFFSIILILALKYSFLNAKLTHYKHLHQISCSF